MKAITTSLLSWYDEKAKRNLPWKKDKDPYKIWLSEIIMQQTRVEQGTPYYLHFVEKYPDVHILADAPEDSVLKSWQGLGYYNRARNLHATAKQISAERNGRFPISYEELRSLKGVGDYTAAAIASFAYNQVFPAIDGNAMRVLSRLFGEAEAVDTAQGKKKFLQLAEKIISGSRPGDFNQAIMDLGAEICTPAKPICQDCPLQVRCEAFKSRTQQLFPVKTKRIKPRNRHILFPILYNGEKTALEKRKNKDIWHGLYCFPLVDMGLTKNDKTLDQFLKQHQIKPIRKQNIGPVYTHQLSHQKILAQFILVECSGWESQFKAVKPELIRTFAIPGLIDRFLQDKSLTFNLK